LFVDDISLSSQYFAVTIRSPRAGRRLKDIHCPVLDSKYKLIRAADIPGAKLLAGSSVPVLADENISYIGEPVAILAGPDAVKLDELALEISVETEAGASGDSPVFSLDAPNAEIAAQIMLDIDASIKNTSAEKEKPPDNSDIPASSAEDAEEPRLITGTYRTGIQEHWYSDPHGAFAVPAGKGVIIHTATQWPDHVRRSVAEALSLPYDDVLLELTDIGMHFDGKIWYPSLIAVHSAIAAFIMKQPVKLMLTREDDFRFSPKRPETVIEFSTRLDSKGEASGTEIAVRAGFGADGFFADEMLSSIAKAAAGYYKLGRIKLNAKAVLTNLPPACPFSGFGAAQGVFALERHIAKIADTLGVEGAEWRRQRYNEKKIPVDELVKLSENLMTQSDYRRKWAAYELLRGRIKTTSEKISPMRGIGISTVIYEDKKPHFVFKPAAALGATALRAAAAADEAVNERPPLAAVIIELEIDDVDFSAKIRGIWMSVCTGLLSDKRTMRRRLLQNIICSLGWTVFEKLNYTEGRVHENDYFNYRIPAPSAIPRIHIFLSERESNEANTEVLSELPYCVIPAAYLQALTQACDHHFESIPVFPRDIWTALQKNEQEPAGEKEE
jgi:CO/xanthine dehydrogenase Mo-binding subunit